MKIAPICTAIVSSLLLAAKLSPDRYSVEIDDGEDILIKKKEGQPDFALELIESNVQNVSIKVEGE